MEFKFYKEPFDTKAPPPAPPNRDVWRWPLLGWVETRESKQRGQEYQFRLEEYSSTFTGTSAEKIKLPAIDLEEMVKVTSQIKAEHERGIIRVLQNMQFNGIPVIKSPFVQRMTLLIPEDGYENFRDSIQSFEPTPPGTEDINEADVSKED